MEPLFIWTAAMLIPPVARLTPRAMASKRAGYAHTISNIWEMTPSVHLP